MRMKRANPPNDTGVTLGKDSKSAKLGPQLARIDASLGHFGAGRELGQKLVPKGGLAIPGGKGPGYPGRRPQHHPSEAARTNLHEDRPLAGIAAPFGAFRDDGVEVAAWLGSGGHLDILHVAHGLIEPAIHGPGPDGSPFHSLPHRPALMAHLEQRHAVHIRYRHLLHDGGRQLMIVADRDDQLAPRRTHSASALRREAASGVPKAVARSHCSPSSKRRIHGNRSRTSDPASSAHVHESHPTSAAIFFVVIAGGRVISLGFQLQGPGQPGKTRADAKKSWSRGPSISLPRVAYHRHGLHHGTGHRLQTNLEFAAPDPGANVADGEVIFIRGKGGDRQSLYR